MTDLAMLGISLDIGPSKVYHDDGFVDSIYEHEQKLKNMYNIQQIVPQNSCIGENIIIHHKDKLEHHHIFYLDKNPVSNAQVRGHEETHSLESFSALDLLEKLLLDEQGFRVNFDKISDPEIIASIGGLYAVLKQGFTIRSLDRVYTHPQLQKAKKVLNNSLTYKKRVSKALTSLLHI